jgi:SAM-dependent methyltransferase
MSQPTININDAFFDSVYKEVWKGIIPAGLSEAETEFILNVCSLTPGSKLLDLMCGYGRHSLSLGRKGVCVTAVDNLSSYIQEISETATKEDLPVNALVALAQRFEFGTEEFDAVICMGNSFSFFGGEEAQQLLQRIRTSLKTGGYLIINSWMIAEIVFKYFREKEWHEINGYKYLLDNKLHFLPTRIDSQQTIIDPAGSIEELQGVDYIYSIEELSVMLHSSGLQLKTLYSTPRKKPFTLGDGRVYIVAQKV